MGIISVNTWWTIWLLVHLILSVALLGALTHQAVAVMMPVRQIAGPPGFVTRFRSVPAAGYAVAVCLLWVCAVERRRFPVGASPTRQPLQPEATGAAMEATKWLKPSV